MTLRSFWKLKRRTQTKNFLAISFRLAAEGSGEEPHKNERKFFVFARARYERARGAESTHKRSVRVRFASPRAPRVRSGFAQCVIILHKTRHNPNRENFLLLPQAKVGTQNRFSCCRQRRIQRERSTGANAEAQGREQNHHACLPQAGTPMRTRKVGATTRAARD